MTLHEPSFDCKGRGRKLPLSSMPPMSSSNNAGLKVAPCLVVGSAGGFCKDLMKRRGRCWYSFTVHSYAHARKCMYQPPPPPQILEGPACSLSSAPSIKLLSVAYLAAGSAAEGRWPQATAIRGRLECGDSHHGAAPHAEGVCAAHQWALAA